MNTTFSHELAGVSPAIGRHFEVPRPEDGDPEALHFYKYVVRSIYRESLFLAQADQFDVFLSRRWVLSLHQGYRAFHKGTVSILNEERIKQLNEIGFEFKKGSPKGPAKIPDVPFERRVEQLRRLEDELGDINELDYRYDE